jgi:hypothetical protein
MSILLISFFSINVQADSLQELPLSEFYAGNSMLRLNGERAAMDLPITLSPLVKVTSATLNLQAISSIALIEHRSVLSIRFNNTTVGQIAFDPKKPALSANIDIPASLWRNEYNTLSFVASHHSTICQAVDAPELWSEINLDASSLSLKTTTNVKDLNLQQLSNYFHPGIGSQRAVKMFSFENDTHLSDIKRSVLSSIAQGLALREQYRGLKFDYQTLTQFDKESTLIDGNKIEHEDENYNTSSWYLGKTQSDDLHVIVGTRETLVNVVSTATINSIKGPFIKIEQTPEIKMGKEILVASHVRLIISGLTGKDLIEAAENLAYMDDELNPDNAINLITQPSLTRIPTQQNVTLKPGETYGFGEIGIESFTFNGEGLFSKQVQIRLPADFYVTESAMLQLTLDFGYGAGFGPGSTFNILINDQVVDGVVLDEREGGFFHNYKLSLSSRLLKGGLNNLVFNVSQKTQPVQGECSNITGDYLYFNLNDISEITIPEAAYLARQPDLKLMSQTGYPFAKFTHDEEVSIYITQPEMISAALTMAGKLAQSSSNLIPNLNIVFGLPETMTDNALILAKPSDLNEALFDSVSASITNTKKWPYRLQNYLYKRVTKNKSDAELKEDSTSGFTVEESSLGQLSILMAFANPYSKENGTLFIITADSSDLLTNRVEQLVQSSLWSQLSGDFFVWESASKPLFVTQISTPYQVGKANTWLELSALFSNNPLYWLIAALLVALMLSAITYLLLKRRHQKIKAEW